MKKYRFSPILSERVLFEAIRYTHVACHALCKQSFGKYLPVAGNIGIFCHHDNEYAFLTNLRKKRTDESKSIFGKYFQLHHPITGRAKDGIPKTIYTHLYIRKPDANHPQVGDVDFYLSPMAYKKLKQAFLDGKKFRGARIFPRKDLDMIEVFDPNIDVLGYVRTDESLTVR